MILVNEQRIVEFRALENAENKMIIEGYAIVFESPATHIIDGKSFTEVIKKEALTFTDMNNVPLRYNHNDNYCILASTSNKSLQLKIDDIGLKIIAELIDTQANRDMYKCIKAGLINKMSFAFSVAENGDNWEFSEAETYRVVTNIKKLYDVSVVDSPFYDTTTINVRTSEIFIKNFEEFRSTSNLNLRKLQLLKKYKK